MPPLGGTADESPARAARWRRDAGSLASTVELADDIGEKPTLCGFLTVYVDKQPASVFWPLYGGDTTVGRAGGGGQPDISLNAASVSANHARISCNAETGAVVLHDQGSRNGTELNGTRLGSGDARGLKDGDRIGIGRVQLVIKLLPR